MGVTTKFPISGHEKKITYLDNSKYFKKVRDFNDYEVFEYRNEVAAYRIGPFSFYSVTMLTQKRSFGDFWLSFEEFFELLPKEIKMEISYHLDLFLEEEDEC